MWPVKIAPLFFMKVLEMDEGSYVDTFFISDTKEGGKLQFYHHLSIFDTGQNCPAENFDGKFGPHDMIFL